MDARGQVVGDAYVEVGPADPAYARLAPQAVSEAEFQARRRRWRDGDEALRREFESYLARRGQAGEDGAGQGGAGQGGAGQGGAGQGGDGQG
jgi:hypothetical protein